MSVRPTDGFDGVRRVLAVRLDNLGDVVMTGPALRALRSALPAAHVTLMASPGGSLAAPLLPWVDDVLVHRALWQDVSGARSVDPAAEQALVTRLRDGRFDAALILTSFSQSPHPPAYALYLAGVPRRVGQSREFGGGVLSHPVAPPPDGTHQVDRNLHLLEAVGLAGAPPRSRPTEPDGVSPDRALEIAVSDAAVDGLDRALGEIDVPHDAAVTVLAPGASAPSRRYAPERFAAVARSLARDEGRRVVVVGSAREGDLVDHVASAAASAGVVSLAGRLSVGELAALIARADLLVANNSAAMHLADALHRPMVVLFAGTDREGEWRPRSAPAILLRRPTRCAPCRLLRCAYDHECLDVPAEEVLAAARQLASA